MSEHKIQRVECASIELVPVPKWKPLLAMVMIAVSSVVFAAIGFIVGRELTQSDDEHAMVHQQDAAHKAAIEAADLTERHFLVDFPVVCEALNKRAAP